MQAINVSSLGYSTRAALSVEKDEHVFVGEARAGEAVGIAELENGDRIVRFLAHDLGVSDRDRRFHRFVPPRARLRCAVKPAETNREWCQECCRSKVSGICPVVQWWHPSFRRTTNAYLHFELTF